MRPVKCRAAAVGPPVERVLCKTNVSVPGRAKRVRSFIDEGAPGVMRRHGEVLGESLFQARLQGMKNRGPAITSQRDSAPAWIQTPASRAGNGGVAVHPLEQSRAFRPDITHTQRPVFLQFSLQLQRELLG